MPDAGIEIDFITDGGGAVVSALLASAAAADKAAAAMERQEKAARTVAGPNQRLGALSSQKSQAEASGDRGVIRDVEYAERRTRRTLNREEAADAPKAERLPDGPYQRRGRIERQRGAAEASGDADKVRDVALRQRQNDRQITRAEKGPPDFLSKLTGVVKSSRIGAGGGLMPLVGQLSGLLGPEGLAFAAVAEAGMKAARALYDMTADAADAGRTFSNLSFASGSGPQDTARLASMGNAIGLSPEQMGGLAQSFNQRITTDPVAMGYGAELGVQNAPGQFGNQDWGENLITAIDHLRTVKDPQRQLLEARNTGLEAALPFTKLSEQTWDRLKEDSKANSGVMTPDFQGKSLEFTASTGRMKEGLDLASASLTGPFMDAITGVQNFIGNELHSKTALAFLSGSAEAGLNSVTGGLGGVVLALLGGGSKSDPQAAQTDALNKNTAAVQAQTAVMQQGAYGNGERFRQVTGDIQGGEFLRRSLEQGGLALGSF